MMIKVGSMQSPGGEIWDYKGRSEIVKIYISHSVWYVYSIQFLYVESSGTLALSEKHGGSSGNIFNVVKLDYPSEFITWITGYSTGSYLKSVTIGTNKAQYGPFGCPTEQHNFNFQIGDDNVFGGFHGSSWQNGCIESMGVYVKPIASLNNPNKIKKEEI